MPRTTMDDNGYATVGDLRMYYEVHGSGGTPLLLLHGEFATIGMFNRILPALAETRTVIAVEQQGHGHTADVDRPLSFEQMADDTAAVLERLGVKSADVFGYSGGASVAQHLAVRHPGRVRKLALASAVYDTNGYAPGVMEGIRNATPDGFPPIMRQIYEQVAPDRGDWAGLVAKTSAMARHPDDVDPSRLEAITAPTLVIIGDKDIVRPDYAAKMAHLLHTELVIVPGDHSSYIEAEPDALLATLTEFLDTPAPDPGTTKD